VSELPYKDISNVEGKSSSSLKGKKRKESLASIVQLAAGNMHNKS
jgi:hypothetical protein